MMKKIHGKTIQSLLLMLEAFLVLLSLATGAPSIVGMTCYWALVAVYHLADFMGKLEDDTDHTKERMDSKRGET